LTAVSSSEPIDRPAYTLRDGRSATLGPARVEDEAQIERLVSAADASRSALYEHCAGANGGALVAHDERSAELIGFIAYADTGELVGVVDPRFRGLGLGTLLVHEAAARAAAAGIERLRVELHPGSEATGEMLRDAGLAAHWEIDYPVTRVTLRLGTSRPGWTTPKPGAGS
jgi:GNAT superfamily N-acetyltransferase